jgi:plastocyanin
MRNVTRPGSRVAGRMTAVTVLVGMALLCGACTEAGSVGLGPPTVTQSSGAAAAPSPTALPSAMSATAIPPAAGGCAATSVPTKTSPRDVRLIAKNLLFEQPSVQAPGSSFVLVYANQDMGIQHNIHVLGPHGETICHPAAFAGAATEAYAFTGLAAGVYLFHCDLHLATMQGQLTVP